LKFLSPRDQGVRDQGVRALEFKGSRALTP
jgi:hypothetical protein